MGRWKILSRPNITKSRKANRWSYAKAPNLGVIFCDPKRSCNMEIVNFRRESLGPKFDKYSLHRKLIAVSWHGTFFKIGPIFFYMHTRYTLHAQFPTRTRSVYTARIRSHLLVLCFIFIAPVGLHPLGWAAYPPWPRFLLLKRCELFVDPFFRNLGLFWTLLTAPDLGDLPLTWTFKQLRL